jgi:hypothetical protein
VGRLTGRVRDALQPGPRLVVFDTDDAHTTSGRAVALRLSSTAGRTCSTAAAVVGGVVAGLSPWIWPDLNGPFVVGILIVVGASLPLRAKLPVTDPTISRAAIRAVVNEGRRVGRQRWRIDGPAALELGKEIRRLQTRWMPGRTGLSFDPPDPARDALMAQHVGPRLAPYLGPLTANERQLWLGNAPELAPEQEPDHRAQSYEPGTPWPRLGSAEPEWPTLPRREET